MARIHAGRRHADSADMLGAEDMRRMVANRVDFPRMGARVRQAVAASFIEHIGSESHDVIDPTERSRLWGLSKSASDPSVSRATNGLVDSTGGTSESVAKRGNMRSVRQRGIAPDRFFLKLIVISL